VEVLWISEISPAVFPQCLSLSSKPEYCKEKLQVNENYKHPYSWKNTRGPGPQGCSIPKPYKVLSKLYLVSDNGKHKITSLMGSAGRYQNIRSRYSNVTISQYNDMWFLESITNWFPWQSNLVIIARSHLPIIANIACLYWLFKQMCLNFRILILAWE